MSVTVFTPAFNDVFLVLTAGYAPGSGVLHVADLSSLPSDVPSTGKHLRLSVARQRDGAKTILIATGRSGLTLTGVAVAEGKTDIPVDSGDRAKVTVSAGYINDLQVAVNAIEAGGGSQGPTGPQGPAGPTGPTGATGAAGSAGAAGATGAAGSVWREGSGAPSNGTGVDGDFYLNGSNGDVYKRVSGSYAIQCNILGATGATGPTGPTGPTGATGSAGSAGSTGSAGAAGSVWREGSGAPSNGTGIDGDFYLDGSTGDVYKRISGSYAVQCNIKGATGSTGAAGSTGATGSSGVAVATAPITYDSGTQTVAITIPTATVLKGAGSNTFGVATAGTDYLDPSSSLDASKLTGAIADARLSSNVPLKSAGSNTFSGSIACTAISCHGATFNYTSSSSLPDSGSYLSQMWIPRFGDLSNFIFQDHQDELYYSDKRATVTFSPAANTFSGALAGAEIFRDDSTFIEWTNGTSPSPIVITVDFGTGNIGAKNNATTFALGITTRSGSGSQITNVLVEFYDSTATSYTTVFNGLPTVLSGSNVFLTGDLSALSGSSFNIPKLRVTLTTNAPLTAALRIQRLMLYHTTAAWNPWHLSIGGGTLYGDVTHNDGTNIIAGTTTGTKVGSSSLQKFGFFGATPIVQPASTDLLTAAKNLGLVASSVTLPSTTYYRTTSNSGTLDLSAANWYVRTLDGTNASTTLSNVSSLQEFTLELVQDATGNRAWTPFSGITWITPGGVVPTIAPGVGTSTILRFKQTGSGAYLGWWLSSTLDYPSTVLATSGLVSYYKLDETSGTTATDSKGSNNGTYSGSFVLGARGMLPGTRACWLNGTNAYIALPAISLASISVEVWVQAATFAQDCMLVCKNPVNTEWELMLTSSTLVVWRGGSSGDAIDGPTGLPMLGNWHHIVATQTGSTAVLYIDGVQVGSNAIATAIGNGTTAGTNEIDIGRYNAAFFYKGSIAHVALYNTVLSAATVLQHYNAGTQLPGSW